MRKRKDKRRLMFTTSLIIILVLTLSWNVLQKQTPVRVRYEVEECKQIFRGEEKATRLADYDKRSKVLSAEVFVNCCGTEVKVEKENSIYKILEKQVGTLCRCMCKRKVRIFDVSESSIVEFIDKDGNKFILTPHAGFCGWSTYGRCNSDKDCVKGGCSAQVCQSRFEEPVVTTCEWLDCYNSKKYEVECKCIEGKCQWS